MRIPTDARIPVRLRPTAGGSHYAFGGGSAGLSVDILCTLAARLATKIQESSDIKVELIEGKERELTVKFGEKIIADQDEKFLPQKQILEIILEQAKQ